MQLRPIAALVLTVAVPALIGGCGAGINTAQALPSLSGSSNTAGLGTVKQRVRFVIRLPRKTRHHGRSPSYLSYATKSMQVSVALGGVRKLNKIVDLTVSSNGCTSTAVNANCEFDAALPPANGYVASFTTYDRTGGKGNELSAAVNTVFNVLKGQSIVVGLTLDGVPVKLTTFAATNGFYAITLDADGNMIVGPGAPQIAATSRGATVATIVQPLKTSPNMIRVTQIPNAGGDQFIDITASYPIGATNSCVAKGAVCTFPGVATVQAGQTLFLANDYGQSPSSVFGFKIPLTTGQAPDEKITIDDPFTLGLDGNDNLFVPQYQSSGSLFEYAAPYRAPIASACCADDVEGMAIAADGKIFMTADGYVEEFVPPYNSAPLSFTGLSTSYGIGVDASDNVYLTGGAVAADTTMDVFSPPYTSASTPVHTVTLASNAQYPVLVSGNKVFVGEENGIEVFNLPITTNNPSPAITLTSGVDYAYGLALDAKGNLYVANYYGGSGNDGSVLIYDAPLTSGESPSVTLNAYEYPQDVVLDNAGNVYVSTYEGGSGGDGSLLEFNPPFTNTSTPVATVAASSGIYEPYGDGLAITKSSSFTLTLNQ